MKLHVSVPGVWGCWSEMSKCSVSCGQGVSARSRQCQSLPPGKPYTIPCNIMYLMIKLFVPGVWGCWSEMSKCSVSCGQGVTARSRQCQSLPPGKPYTIPCDGEAEEITQCSEGPCISKCQLLII